jgi:general secretion pathway protein L
MLNDFWSWWRRQMQDLVTGWRQHAPAARNAIIVAIHQLRLEPVLTATGAIIVRRDGRETERGTLDFPQPLEARGDARAEARAEARGEANALPALPAGLRLPPGMVLCREVALPLAAERDFAAAIGFEIDRLTPFAADEIFWSTSVISRQPGPAGLRLNLLIVLRRPVEALAEALARLNLRPGFVESPHGRIELTTAPATAPWRRPLHALCLVLALACLVTPVIRQQLALQSAARQIAGLAPARQEALALRRTLATAAAGAAALADARSSDVLQNLAGLTAALPDGTSLDDLTLKGGDLTFDGRSSNAAGLIATLAAAPHFHNPSFTAPVTRTANGNADLFSLHVTVAP